MSHAPAMDVTAGTANAVATAHPLATAAALATLRDGGNAADAAAAAAWMLAVCEPSGSGLGGQATVLVHRPGGACTVLDGHSHAPQGVTRRTVDRDAQRRGPRATTVPSMPATIGALAARFGRLPVARTLAPAIQAAHEGIPVSPLLRRHIQWCRSALGATAFGARTFLVDGRAPRRGALLRQRELGSTLERLAAHGVPDFYLGALAHEMAEGMRAAGGFVTEADLASAAEPAEREALAMDFRGHEVVTAPPPAGGLQLLFGLRLAEALGLDEVADDDGWYERFALVVDGVFRERSRLPLAPHRLTPSLVDWMLGAARANEVAAEALARVPRARVREAEGPGDTTHLCVADADGMVVSLTQSIQSLFGAKVADERLGFFWNNYLTTCSRRRGPAMLRRGARPQSNAAPTIVFRGPAGSARTPWFALGAAGSRRIISSLLHVIAQTVLRGRTPADAIAAPRVHATLGGAYMVESGAASDALLARLAARFRGPHVPRAAHSYAMGCVQAIVRTRNGAWSGVADPRREGVADGF
ncbi:MAG: gamma-glutamyltransferase [Candidatus Eisenbacteria bacterium]